MSDPPGFAPRPDPPRPHTESGAPPMRTNSRRRIFAAVAATCALALGATACGSPDPGTDGAAKDVASALEAGGKVTVWAWEPTLKKAAADFEKKHPKVDVELVNAGTGDKQYTALQNAIAAGSGAPDVAQVEYYAVGQFAIGKSLEELSPTVRQPTTRPSPPVPGARSGTARGSTPSPWTPDPWRCSTTRRSSTGTGSPSPPPGTSMSKRRAPCTRRTRSSSSRTTPGTPAPRPA